MLGFTVSKGQTGAPASMCRVCQVSLWKYTPWQPTCKKVPKSGLPLYKRCGQCKSEAACPFRQCADIWQMWPMEQRSAQDLMQAPLTYILSALKKNKTMQRFRKAETSTLQISCTIGSCTPEPWIRLVPAKCSEVKLHMEWEGPTVVKWKHFRVLFPPILLCINLYLFCLK